jgi:hypothetical protein
MSIVAQGARKPKSDQDQKKVALGHVKEAWMDAWLDGIDAECMAQVSLFVTMTELVATHGEEATARFAASLPKRISAGEFSIRRPKQ